jgi:BirA family transcriptional regulator, biotin operon repressor / biotin---[acetyl-CoA-carboxylase] ligase
LYKIPANTLFAGKRLVFMPSCHSTNTIAMEMVRSTATLEGTVVIAHEQTAGRGQQGSAWVSEPGKNLTFSLILKPTFLPVGRQHYLTFAVALGLHDLLAGFGLQAAIKWPNDLYVEQLKLCGILIENTLKGNFLDTSVVGIGLNVNQRNFPMAQATSLVLATGLHFELPLVFEKLMTTLEKRYLQLRSGQYEALRADYHQALFMRNQAQAFRVKGQSRMGIVREVDELGRLVVEWENRREAYQNKEIEWVFAESD